jgi:hypothetical protein
MSAKNTTSDAHDSKENGMSARRLISSTVTEWAKATSIHGVPNITRNRITLMTVVWLACLILSNIFCAYLIYKSVHEYFQYSVHTQIRTMNEIPMPMPAVSVCNQNPFTTATGRQFALDYIREVVNESSISSYDDLKQFAFIDEVNLFSDESKYKDFFEDMVIQAKHVAENRKSFGYKIDEIMLQCYFNYEKCNFTRE